MQRQQLADVDARQQHQRQQPRRARPAAAKERARSAQGENKTAVRMGLPSHVAVPLWVTFNISTILMNKYLYQMVDFKFPLTLTLIHMLSCMAGSFLVLRVAGWVPFIDVPWKDIKQKTLPLSLIFILNIVLGNFSLRWIPVSFMQTIKSLVPFLTVLMEVYIFKKSFPPVTYLTLVPIVGGVALATWSEVNFVFIGFLCAVLGSISTAAQTGISSFLLSGKYKFDSVNLIYYMAPPSAALLLPLSYTLEGEHVSAWWATLETPHTAFMLLCVSGSVAFLLNMFTFLAIQSTSALTFNVIGNLKVVVVISLSVAIFKNEITVWNGLGCAVAVAGVLWYNYEKRKLAAMNNLPMQLDEKVKNDRR